MKPTRYRIRQNNGRITSRAYKTRGRALKKVRRLEAAGEDFLFEREIYCRFKTIGWWTVENQRGMANILRELGVTE